MDSNDCLVWFPFHNVFHLDFCFGFKCYIDAFPIASLQKRFMHVPYVRYLCTYKETLLFCVASLSSLALTSLIVPHRGHTLAFCMDERQHTSHRMYRKSHRNPGRQHHRHHAAPQCDCCSSRWVIALVSAPRWRGVTGGLQSAGEEYCMCTYTAAVVHVAAVSGRWPAGWVEAVNSSTVLFSSERTELN